MSTKSLLPLFFLLASLSFLMHHFVPAYLPVGEQLLTNNTFSKGAQGWEKRYNQDSGRINIAPNHITFTTYSQPTSLQIFQRVDADKLQKTVLFKASAKSSNVLKGKHDWNQARVLLVQYENNKATFKSNHQLVTINGSTAWKDYVSVFTIEPQTEDISIILQISQATGELECRDISLYNTTNNPLHKKLHAALVGAWAIFILHLLLPYLKSSRVLVGLILLTLAILLFGITMNGSMKNSMRNEIYKELNASIEKVGSKLQTLQSRLEHQSLPSFTIDRPTDLPDQTFKEQSFDITKLAHLLLFMTLGILLKRNGAKTTLLVVLDILLLACITEIFQLFIEGRSALLHDVAIDFIGGIIGIGIALLVLKRNTDHLAPDTTRGDS